MKLLIAFFFVLLVAYFFHPIPLQGPNVDLGHHLLLGKIIVETRSVPHINLISYTHPNYEFVNSQWLSEVVFYLWHALFGWNGLIVLAIILITSSFALILRTATRFASLYAVGVTALLYLQIFIDRTEVKPELFSWLFLSLFLFVLFKYKEKYTRWIYLLIPLEVLWVNFHIYYFVGCALLLFFLIDAYIAKKKAFSSKKFKTLLGVSIACGLSTFINPFFAKGAFYPFFVLSNYGYKVIENRSIFEAWGYANATFGYFLIAVFFLAIYIALNLKKTLPIQVFIFAFCTFMSFFAIRNFPLFIFGTLALFAIFIDSALLLIKSKFGNKHFETVKVVLLMCVLAVIIPTAKWSLELHELGLGIKDNAYEATNFIKKNHITGPIYNNYNIGNYLQYRLYPQERVFVDGNPEEYPQEFFRDIYYPSEASFEGFRKIDKKYNFNVIFYEHKNQTLGENILLNSLVKSDTWKMVYANSSVVLFVKNNQQNKKVIDRYYIQEKDVVVGNSLPKNDYRELSNFYRVVGWLTPMYEADMKYLEFEPDNCVALRHVAVIAVGKKDPLAPMYMAKFREKCS